MLQALIINRIVENIKDKDYLQLIKDQLELYDQRIQLILKEREVLDIVSNIVECEEDGRSRER